MVRHRTSPRNGCISASEQLFFDFRVTREAAGRRGRSGQAHENRGEDFSRGGVIGTRGGVIGN